MTKEWGWAVVALCVLSIQIGYVAGLKGWREIQGAALLIAAIIGIRALILLARDGWYRFRMKKTSERES